MGDNKKTRSTKAPYLNGLKEIKKTKDGGEWHEPGIKPLEFNMSDIPKTQWEQIFGKKEREKVDNEIEEKKKAIKENISKKT